MATTLPKLLMKIKNTMSIQPDMFYDIIVHTSDDWGKIFYAISNRWLVGIEKLSMSSLSRNSLIEHRRRVASRWLCDIISGKIKINEYAYNNASVLIKVQVPSVNKTLTKYIVIKPLSYPLSKSTLFMWGMVSGVAARNVARIMKFSNIVFNKPAVKKKPKILYTGRVLMIGEPYIWSVQTMPHNIVRNSKIKLSAIVQREAHEAMQIMEFKYSIIELCNGKTGIYLAQNLPCVTTESFIDAVTHECTRLTKLVCARNMFVGETTFTNIIYIDKPPIDVLQKIGATYLREQLNK